MDKQQRRKCSFCGRSEKEVQMLVTGVSGCICDECARLANEVVEVLQKGYICGDKVIRYAMVKVAN